MWGDVIVAPKDIDHVDRTVNIREVQPTLFFAVPRIWEKLKAAVEVRMAAAEFMLQVKK